MKSRYITSILFLAYMVFGLTMCSHKNSNIELDFTVKTEDNNRLAAASIYINGLKVGTSDQNGQFTYTKELPAGQKIKIEVNKESEDFFFSDYREVFEVPESVSYKRPIEVSLSSSPKIIEQPSTTSMNDIKPIEILNEPQAVVTANSPPSEGITNEAAKEIDNLNSPPTKEAEIKIADLAPEKKVIDNQKTEVTNPIMDLKPKDFNPSENNYIHTFQASAQDLSTLKKISITNKEPPKAQPKKYLYTVQVLDKQKKPLDDVQLSGGYNETGHIEPLGKTDSQGIFVISYLAPQVRNMKLFAVKQGYSHVGIDLTLKPKTKSVVTMDPTVSLNFKTLTKRFNFTKGVPKVNITINDVVVGVTDEFGQYTHQYEGPKGEVLNIKLESKDFIPESYTTSIVIGDSFELTKFYQTSQPATAKLYMADVIIHQTQENSPWQKISESIQKTFANQLQTEIYKSPIFERADHQKINQAMNNMDVSLPHLFHEGWSNTDLNPYMDVLVSPEIVMGDKIMLFVNSFTANGQRLFSIYQPLENPENPTPTIERIVKSFTSEFPIEGTIVRFDNKDNIVVNLGQQNSTGCEKGKTFEVYGLEFNQNQTKLNTKRVAELELTAVGPYQSQAKIVWQNSKSDLGRGDLIVKIPKVAINNQPMVSHKNEDIMKEPNTIQNFPSFEIIANHKGNQIPISGANVYLNNSWIGSTDEAGRLNVPIAIKGSVALLVHKHGFPPLEKKIQLQPIRQTFVMNATMSSLIINSIPSGKKVKIDGKVIGHTPILKPYPISFGFTKLEIEGGSGYKNWQKVIEAKTSMINYSAEKSVQLEKDFVSMAQMFVDQNQPNKAVEIYEQVKVTDNDYTTARHALGILYLEKLNEPEKAVLEFEAVIKQPSNEQLVDKRFVVAYSNLANAYFKLGNSQFTTNPKESAKSFKKASEHYAKALSNSQYFPKDSYFSLKHNTLYSLALTYQKLFYLTNHRPFLQKAKVAWNDYSDFFQFQLKEKAAFQTMISNAQLYIKEVDAHLSTVTQ